VNKFKPNSPRLLAYRPMIKDFVRGEDGRLVSVAEWREANPGKLPKGVRTFHFYQDGSICESVKGTLRRISETR